MHVDVSMVAYYVKKGGDNATEFRLVTHGHLKHAGKRAHTGEICTRNTIVGCRRIQHPPATIERNFFCFFRLPKTSGIAPWFADTAIPTDYGIFTSARLTHPLQTWRNRFPQPFQRLDWNAAMPAHGFPCLKRATVHPQLDGTHRHSQATRSFCRSTTGPHLKPALELPKLAHYRSNPRFTVFSILLQFSDFGNTFMQKAAHPSKTNATTHIATLHIPEPPGGRD